MLLYLLNIGKTWFHVTFTAVDSIFSNTDMLRTKFSNRLNGNTMRRFSNVDEDEIGDVKDDITTKTVKDNVFRIDMKKLDGALSRRNLFN